MFKNPYFLFGFCYIGIGILVQVFQVLLGLSGGSAGTVVAPMVSAMVVGQVHRRATKRLYEKKEAWILALKLGLIAMAIGAAFLILMIMSDPEFLATIGLPGFVAAMAFSFVLSFLVSRFGLNFSGEADLKNIAARDESGR